MLINSCSTQKLSYEAFQKMYATCRNSNTHVHVTKYLQNSNNFQHVSHQYFDFGLRVLRASYKAEFANNLTAFSKLNSCHMVFNYSASKHNLNSDRPYKFENQLRNVNQQKSVSHLMANGGSFKISKCSKLNFGIVCSNRKAEQKNPLNNVKTACWTITKWPNAHLMRADWLLEHLLRLCQSGRSPRAIINSLIRSCGAFIRTQGSASPVLGLHITATGRLGSQKKGMAQQISKSVGKVPLSSFKQKVDYAQSFMTTRRGVIGLKVWVCYS